MLSVNIPVYQYEIFTLVSQLSIQADELEIPFEIRVYDDGSDMEIKKKNREIKKLHNVIYTELKENLGRASIRNKMGLDSKFKYLLFIDADSAIIHDDYLSDYLGHIKPKRVICGGTAYKSTPPEKPEQLLRWVYGTQREAVSAATRNSKKGFIITSNNFMIEKQVFEKIHFSDDLKNYGHEDTLLGYNLFLNGNEIFHIDNPVEHTGLEDSSVFLEKTKLALKNLYYISEILLAGDKKFIQQVNFLNRYQKLSKFVPKGLLKVFYISFGKTMERNLTGKNPHLFWFDAYKITFYSTFN